jgi:multidrug resistance efflux pump
MNLFTLQATLELDDKAFNHAVDNARDKLSELERQIEAVNDALNRMGQNTHSHAHSASDLMEEIAFRSNLFGLAKGAIHP